MTIKKKKKKKVDKVLESLPELIKDLTIDEIDNIESDVKNQIGYEMLRIAKGEDINKPIISDQSRLKRLIEDIYNEY